MPAGSHALLSSGGGARSFSLGPHHFDPAQPVLREEVKDMADNPTIAEIKAAEDRAAASVQEAKSAAARRLNKAQADAETTIKETRQSAARQFRDKIHRAEEAAELKAKSILSEREASAKTFYSKHKDKVVKAASWITEEVMGKYGRG